MDAEGRWPQAKGFAVRLHKSSLLCRSPAASQKTSTKYSGPDFVGQFVNFHPPFRVTQSFYSFGFENFDGDSWTFEVPENEK